jgi:hypothetical protein
MHRTLGARDACAYGLAGDRALERAARCVRRRRHELLPFRARVWSASKERHLRLGHVSNCGP